MIKNITIKTPKGKRTIGPNEPVFIIAEMSGNHNQSYARAKKIIDAQNGEIWCESSGVNKGSTFSFKLPIV